MKPPRTAEVFAVDGKVHCKLIWDDGPGDTVCGVSDEGKRAPEDEDSVCGRCMFAMLKHIDIDPAEFIEAMRRDE